MNEIIFGWHLEYAFLSLPVFSQMVPLMAPDIVAVHFFFQILLMRFKQIKLKRNVSHIICFLEIKAIPSISIENSSFC